MAYPTFSYVRFNPAKAKQWLKINQETEFGNRNLSEPTIAKYTRSMLRGEWSTDNGEDIKIGPNGEILDGQHRLMAVIESGCTVTIGVKFNVPLSTMPTIGDPKGRTAGDMLTILGSRVDTNLLAASSSLLVAYANRASDAITGVTRGKNTTKLEVVDRAMKDDSLAECVALTRRFFKTSLFPNLSAIAFCWRISRGFAAKDHVDKFFESVGGGENLPARDPRLALRNKLIEIKASTRQRGTRTDVAVVIYHILRCLGAYMDSASLTKLALPRGEVIEFPKVRRTKAAA